MSAGTPTLSLPPLLRGSGSPVLTGLVGAVQTFILLTMLLLLIPNPRNREDNTSGVLGLLGIAEWLRDKPALRERVQLAFVDNEELGLLGSAALRSWWHETGHPYADAAIVNLDCISRATIPLVVHHGESGLAARLLPHVQEQLPRAILLNAGVLPLSDNYTFRELGAVDISLADPAVLPGGYTIPRIHTPRDNTFHLERFTYLMTGLCDFLAAEIAAREEARSTRSSGVPAAP
ncbi:MAG: M28 family peptidase [Anaerolineae bacterium]|nr:M28 family peptidase [Anaerolineae bacterium]